jgi:DNA-binding MarR family transcriptional regulator
MKQKTAEMLIRIISVPEDVLRLKGRASQFILIHLANNDGEVPLKNIYSLPNWTNKTLRQHILHLESDGMIELVNDPIDGRSKIASLTNKSRDKLEQYEEKVFEIIRQYA